MDNPFVKKLAIIEQLYDELLFMRAEMFPQRDTP